MGRQLTISLKLRENSEWDTSNFRKLILSEAALLILTCMKTVLTNSVALALEACFRSNLIPNGSVCSAANRVTWADKGKQNLASVATRMLSMLCSVLSMLLFLVNTVGTA